MKYILTFLVASLSFTISHSQFLKKLGTRVKEDVEWRAQRKAGQKIDEGLDSQIGRAHV